VLVNRGRGNRQTIEKKARVTPDLVVLRPVVVVVEAAPLLSSANVLDVAFFSVSSRTESRCSYVEKKPSREAIERQYRKQ
jgi:hypothetical protein